MFERLDFSRAELPSGRKCTLRQSRLLFVLFSSYSPPMHYRYYLLLEDMSISIRCPGSEIVCFGEELKYSLGGIPRGQANSAYQFLCTWSWLSRLKISHTYFVFVFSLLLFYFYMHFQPFLLPLIEALMCLSTHLMFLFNQ